MKLIEKKTNRTASINMYIVDEDKIHHSNDVSNDFFEASNELVVNDIDYCIEQVCDWILGINVYDIMDDGYRMAVIDGILYTNYRIE